MEQSIHSFYLAFLGGLAASITPCVYPLIPVTLAIFGATAEVPRWKAFLLSCSYVLGMAAMYTVLGVFSAFTGALFGQALGNPLIIALISLFLILLSLYTLDIIKFDAAYRWQTKASSVGGRGYFGAFLMGAASGVVAAPCAAPLLITILGLAARMQSTYLGALLLFTYALGFGLIFLALGTFSGLVHKLPRSGDWLHITKFVISAALLLVAIFLIKPLLAAANISLTATPSLRNISLFLAFGVIALLAATIGYRRNLKGVKFLCSLVLALSCYQLLFAKTDLPAGPPGGATAPAWHREIELALQEAQQKQRLVMVDFFAEWCAACIELDTKTFSDSAVRSRLSEFVVARADLTLSNDANDELQRRYSLIGLPAILFLCPGGQEIQSARLEGFEEPDRFLERLERVKAEARCQ